MRALLLLFGFLLLTSCTAVDPPPRLDPRLMAPHPIVVDNFGTSAACSCDLLTGTADLGLAISEESHRAEYQRWCDDRCAQLRATAGETP